LLISARRPTPSKNTIGPTSPKPVALLGADIEFAGRGPGVRHAVGRMMTLN
jgi:hypothetical protein